MTQTDEMLFSAVNEKKIGLIRDILEAGADVNARDNDGVTPLMCAVIRDNEDVAKLLIKSGADTRLLVEKKDAAVEEDERQALKAEINERLDRLRHATRKLSGVVVADKIADAHRL